MGRLKLAERDFWRRAMMTGRIPQNVRNEETLHRGRWIDVSPRRSPSEEISRYGRVRRIDE